MTETIQAPAIVESPARARVLPWILDHFEEVLASAILLFEVTLAFANVLARYLFNASWAFTEELEVSTFVWLVLLGTAIAFRQHAHLNMVFVAALVPKRYQRWVDVVVTVTSLLLFAFLFYYGFLQVQGDLRYNSTTEALEWPQWIFTAGLPIGSLLVMIRILQAARSKFQTETEAVPIV